MRKPVVWVGAAPACCDLCKETIAKVFYDARTRFGPWACLCQACFDLDGVGLGTGRGQKYRQLTDGRFYKVAG
jgi:hypothetical protein